MGNYLLLNMTQRRCISSCIRSGLVLGPRYVTRPNVESSLPAAAFKRTIWLVALDQETASSLAPGKMAAVILSLAFQNHLDYSTHDFHPSIGLCFSGLTTEG